MFNEVAWCILLPADWLMVLFGDCSPFELLWILYALEGIFGMLLPEGILCSVFEGFRVFC